MLIAAGVHHYSFNRRELKGIESMPYLPKQLHPNQAFGIKAMPFDLVEEAAGYASSAVKAAHESVRVAHEGVTKIVNSRSPVAKDGGEGRGGEADA